MSWFYGAMGGFVMAVLTSQFADRGRLSKRVNALIATATFVLAAPLFALMPKAVSSPITSALALAIIVMAIIDSEKRGRLITATKTARFRILMYAVAPAVVLALFLTVGLVFPDVPRLPMVVSGITGLALLLILAIYLSKRNHEN